MVFAHSCCRAHVLCGETLLFPGSSGGTSCPAPCSCSWRVHARRIWMLDGLSRAASAYSLVAPFVRRQREGLRPSAYTVGQSTNRCVGEGNGPRATDAAFRRTPRHSHNLLIESPPSSGRYRSRSSKTSPYSQPLTFVQKPVRQNLESDKGAAT